MYLKLTPLLGDHKIQRQKKKEYSNRSQGRWAKKLPGEKRKKEELLLITRNYCFPFPLAHLPSYLNLGLTSPMAKVLLRSCLCLSWELCSLSPVDH